MSHRPCPVLCDSTNRQSAPPMALYWDVQGANPMKTYAKFAALVVVIVGVLVWLAMGGISDSKTYYKTIAELNQMVGQAKGKRLRVGDDVEQGTITRTVKEVTL